MTDAQHTLVRRLYRPAYRAGLTDRRVSGAILTRARSMVAGLPLADLVGRYSGTELASFGGDLPVVQAAPYLPMSAPAGEPSELSRPDMPAYRSLPARGKEPHPPVVARRVGASPSIRTRSGQDPVLRLQSAAEGSRFRPGHRESGPGRATDTERWPAVARPASDAAEPIVMTVVAPDESGPTGRSVDTGRPGPGVDPIVRAMPPVRVAPVDIRRAEALGRPGQFPELPVPRPAGSAGAGAIAAGSHAVSPVAAGRAVVPDRPPTPGRAEAGVVAAVVPGRSIGTAGAGAESVATSADGPAGRTPSGRSERPEVTERRLVASVHRQFLRRLSIEAERRAVR